MWPYFFRRLGRNLAALPEGFAILRSRPAAYGRFGRFRNLGKFEDPGRLGVPSRSGMRRAGTLDLRCEVPGLSLQPEGVGIMVEGVAHREQGLLQGDGDEPRRKPPPGAYLLQVVEVLRVPPSIGAALPWGPLQVLWRALDGLVIWRDQPGLSWNVPGRSRKKHSLPADAGPPWQASTDASRRGHHCPGRGPWRLSGTTS